MGNTTENSQGEAKDTAKDASKTEPGTGNEDLAHPHSTSHSDNAKSKMPERHDEERRQSPADRPGKKPGEGEPSVS